ncbi:MAG: hypothetical protein LBU05_01445, partial [Bifidobacteriaceae bacterium]|nr:hypothetical protein [Bifidobacteriaceae bacterium]
GHAQEPEDIPPRALGIASTLAAIVVLAGAFGLAAVSSIAGGPSRRRRLAALALLGCPAAVMRAVALGLTAASATVGALAACLAYPLVVAFLGHAAPFGVQFWWGGATVGLAGAALCCAVTVAMMAVPAGGQVSTEPLAVRRRAGDRPVSAWRALPLGLVFAVVAGVLIGSRGARLHQPMPTPVVAMLMGATAASVAAFAWAGPLLVRWSSAVAPSGRLSWRLAAARARHHARSSAKLAVGVAAAMILLGAASGYISAAQRYLGEDAALDAGSQHLYVMPYVTGDALDLVAAVTTALQAPSLEQAAAFSADGSSRQIASAADARADDAYYEFVIGQPDALKVAAAAVADPAGDLPAVDFGGNWMGRFTFSATSALVVISLVLALVLTVLTLGIGVIAQQEERRDADSALLIAGMPRSALARVRALELALAALPAPLASAVLAIMLAVNYEHYDNLALPYVVARFAPLAVVPLAVWLLLSLAVTAATPKADRAAVRKE